MQWVCFFLQFFSISYGSAIVVENESWHSHSPNSFHRHRFSLSDDTTSRFFLSARSVVKLDYFLRRDRTHPLCFLNFPGIFPFLRHNLWPFLVYYDQKKKKRKKLSEKCTQRQIGQTELLPERLSRVDVYKSSLVVSIVGRSIPGSVWSMERLEEKARDARASTMLSLLRR